MKIQPQDGIQYCIVVVAVVVDGDLTLAIYFSTTIPWSQTTPLSYVLKEEEKKKKEYGMRGIRHKKIKKNAKRGNARDVTGVRELRLLIPSCDYSFKNIQSRAC